jgi:hypothetical protein
MKFKNLESDDILISPFKVNKTFTVDNNDSGSGVYSIPITKGSDSGLYGFNINGNGAISAGSSKTILEREYYELPNYYTINTMYYRDINQMKGYIDWFHGTPKNHPTAGVIEYTKTRFLYDTSVKRSVMKLVRPYTRQLHDSATVISVPQELYGESIAQNSVRLIDNSVSPEIILQDDGYGNLYDVAFSSSFANRMPDTNNSGSVIGNVFYNDGFLVITDTGSYSNVGDGSFNLTFDSTQTIYEREYICRVGENEFQHTNNRSLKVEYSSSVGFHGTNFMESGLIGTSRDEFPYELTGYSTMSFKNGQYEIGTELIGEATHSEFSPYVTTIGLYNSFDELVAMAKTAKPIKNDKEMSLAFVVRFDTN